MDIQITEDLIKQVASNANLNLKEDEISKFKEDFKEILNMFETLSEAEVSDKASFHPIPVKNKFNEDVIEASISHEDAMKNVKEKVDGYIRGPKVVN